MTHHFLHDGWTLEAIPGSGVVPPSLLNRLIPATVPGCVHTDLMTAGLIPDPYFGLNERETQWIGDTLWQYRLEFEVAAELLTHARIELACEGLDTIAEVELNGKLLGVSEDMHLPQAFPARQYLKENGNELIIRFSPPLAYAEGMQAKLGHLPNIGSGENPQLPFQFIRKMACNFGWDWGPVLITSGIWRPIFLRAWNLARIEAVRPIVHAANSESARLEVVLDWERADDCAAEAIFELVSPQDEILSHFRHLPVTNLTKGSLSVFFEIDRPELWWPRGHGSQPLYLLKVRLASPDGSICDSWVGKTGLRTARLNCEPDDIGSKFSIEINERPIFCKGANWIPDDCFPSRVDRMRYAQRIEQAANANMNMLRVWGGGIYESDDFYEICDQMGILVWQDFLFVCAAYSESESFQTLVEKEARYHVARLARHPSLVLWCGNNEIFFGPDTWGWREQIEGRAWGLGIYLDLLPKIVAQLACTTPYWPGSPFSGSLDRSPHSEEHGDVHFWKPWVEADYLVFRQCRPRFASEFGHSAAPTFATLKESIPEEHHQPESEAMCHHQRATGGVQKMRERLGEHFEIPTNFHDWVYLTHLIQSRAMECAVEWFRSMQPRCMGALYWQLNDCWPVTSWAAVDGHGRPKPLWYATRRFFAPRLLTIQPCDNSLTLFAINDTPKPWRETLTLERVRFDGKIIAFLSIDLEAPPLGSHRILTIPALFSGSLASPNEFIVASGLNHRATWFFDDTQHLHYPPPAFTHKLLRDGDHYKLTITTQSLLRDVCLYADLLDPDILVNDQLITLLPGESFTFAFTSKKEIHADELVRKPVFQCANGYERTKTGIQLSHF